jgi:prevent-host-death family protein
MQTVSYTKAREKFAGLLDQVSSTREGVIIHRRGHEDVALVPADELRGGRGVAISARRAATRLSSPKSRRSAPTERP